MRKSVSKLHKRAILGRAKTRRLDRTGSLQGLIARAARARALAKDPTGALERATRLVEAARKARRLCRARIRSLHIGPSGRVIYARAKSAADLPALTAELGDLFTAGLAGTGLVVTIVTRTAAPPKGALRIEDFNRRAHAAAAKVRGASAALAIGGMAAAAPAFADGPPLPQSAGRETLDTSIPVATLHSNANWACDFAPPERIYEVRLRTAGESVASVQLLSQRDGAGSARALEFARALSADLLRRDPLAIVGENGERVIGVTRYRDQNQLDLQVAACAPAPAAATRAPMVAADPAAPPAPPPASEPMPLATPAASGVTPIFDTPRAYREIGFDYVDRTEQHGLIASGVAQWEIGPQDALNAQVAIGEMDGFLAAGAQMAVQRFRAVGANSEAAIGAFLSAVNSKAPNDEDLAIYRAGAGISVVGEETQIVVRGGYAGASGLTDDDGGFLRVEAAWFPIERLSLEAFIEEDPITGPGAGIGVSARPFSDVFSNLMVDADAAWHEDGEESFRIGLRWLIGEQANASERDRRAKRGMVPYMPQEFERLPDSDDKSQAPYGGEADDPPADTSNTAAFLE